MKAQCYVKLLCYGIAASALATGAAQAQQDARINIGAEAFIDAGISAASQNNPASTAGLSDSGSVKTESKRAVSPVAALYAFMRTLATDELSDPLEQDIASALIRQTKLDPKDRDVLAAVSNEYAAKIRFVHTDPQFASDAFILQRSEVQAYAYAIQRLRKEISPDGLSSLRDHVEAKRQKMELHTRGEK